MTPADSQCANQSTVSVRLKPDSSNTQNRNHTKWSSHGQTNRCGWFGLASNYWPTLVKCSIVSCPALSPGSQMVKTQNKTGHPRDICLLTLGHIATAEPDTHWSGSTLPYLHAGREDSSPIKWPSSSLQLTVYVNEKKVWLTTFLVNSDWLNQKTQPVKRLLG